MATTDKTAAIDPALLGERLVQALYAFIAAQGLGILAKVNEMRVLGALDPKATLEVGTKLPITPQQELMMMGGSLMGLIATIVAGSLFLKWTYRVNKNAKILAPDKPVSAGWSIGWYFVPIAYLWLPYKAMSETWRISADPKNWKTAQVGSVLRWWWGAVLLASMVANLYVQMAMTAANAGAMIAADKFAILMALSVIPLSLLMVGVVRSITALQARRFTAGRLTLT